MKTERFYIRILIKQALKTTSHSAIFENPVLLMHEDQSLPPTH